MDETNEKSLTNLLRESLEYFLVTRKTRFKIVNLSLDGAKLVSNFFQNESNQVTSLLLHNELPLEFLTILSEGFTHSNCKLQAVTLMGLEITAEKLQVLSKWFCHSNCRIQYLSFTFPKIETQDLWNNITDIFILPSNKVVSLWFSLDTLENEICSALKEMLLGTRTLQQFGLSEIHEVTDNYLSQLLSGAIEGGCLKQLGLPLCHLQSRSLGALILSLMDKAKNPVNITHLDFTENMLDGETVREFQKILIHPKNRLLSLKIGYNSYSNMDAAFLLEALSHSNCKLHTLGITFRLERDVYVRQRLKFQIQRSAVKTLECLWEGDETLTPEIRDFQEDFNELSTLLSDSSFHVICCLLAIKVVSRMGKYSSLRILSVDVLRRLWWHMR